MSDQNSEVAPSRFYAWYVLIILTLLYMLNLADRWVTSGLLELIKQDFEVSDSYMALLVGPAFAMIYTFLAVPIARLADRYNRVRIIVTGAVIWSIFTVLSGYASTPGFFAFARIGVGVGEAAFIAPTMSILADYFPPRRRALALAVLNFGVYFGQILGQSGGAAIAAAYDWHMAFYVLGAPGIALGILTLISVREPVRGRLDAGNVADARNPLSFGQTWRLLWSKRSFVFMFFGSAFSGLAGYGFGFWASTLFVRAFDLSILEANTRYGLTAVIFGLSGAVIVGTICDRLVQRDARWPLRLAAIGVLASMLSMIGICLAPNINVATAFVVVGGLTGGGWVVATQAALQNILPAQLRAIGTSLWGFSMVFGGMVIGVQVTGLLTDYFMAEFGAQAIRYALILVLLACVPGFFSLLWASRTQVEDTREFLQQVTAGEGKA